MIEIAYRIPGKGTWRRRTFKTERASEKFVEALIAREGSDVEIQWRTS